MLNSVSSISLVTIYRLETLMELHKVLRQPGFTLPSLLFPVMFYVFFGVLFSMGQGMPSYLLITYGTFGVIGPALFSFGMGVAVERGQGWFELKQVAPMPISAQLVSRTLVSLAFAVVIILLLFTLAATLGNVVLYRWQWLSIAGILLLGVFPFCLFGLALGLYLKANAAPAVVNLIYLPMAFFSGLWVPISLFPEWMQSLALVFPAYHVAQLALSVVDSGQGHHWLLHVGVLFVYSILLSALCYFAFNRKQ